MPSTQEIRRRIKAVNNTRQITKAMELVAAAKMRKAQEMSIKSRDYTQAAAYALNMLAKLPGKTLHSYFSVHSAPKSLLIVITSDKGLAGSYNANVLRKALEYLRSQDSPVELITVGRKAQDFFKKTDSKIIATFTNIPPYPMNSDVRPMIDIALDEFKMMTSQKVAIAYTKFHSTIKQEATVEEILPIIPETAEDMTEYKFEPNTESVIQQIVPRLVEAQFHQKFLDSIASEHSSRMVTMKSASDNAKDIIDDLQLTYNSIRQMSITQELAEITVGAAALE